MSEYHFTISTVLRKEVHLSMKQWKRISNEKHPGMRERLDWVEETLRQLELVRKSRWDSKVSLFYRKFEEYYCCVVVKIENSTGFVITTYLTDKIKIGEIQWKK